ncbi:MAG TPA: response regulator, partial [Saprospiraceae bacterium]|nr:response regulator [Saprospiraceae bacterium]
CREAGMNDYVPKPFIVSQLVSAIAKATGREIKFREKMPLDIEKRETKKTSISDLTYLEKFCEGDRVRMQKYKDLFISSTRNLIEIIQAAIDNSDLMEIANQVHGFKTSLIMMGMSESKELAFIIETACRIENPDYTFIKENTAHLINLIRQAVKELNQNI